MPEVEAGGVRGCGGKPGAGGGAGGSSIAPLLLLRRRRHSLDQCTLTAKNGGAVGSEPQLGAPGGTPAAPALGRRAPPLRPGGKGGEGGEGGGEGGSSIAVVWSMAAPSSPPPPSPPRFGAPGGEGGPGAGPESKGAPGQTCAGLDLATSTCLRSPPDLPV
ncbi:MAG: hypothetical protein R3F14_14970 [Polyangiaceae bacterium]